MDGVNRSSAHFHSQVLRTLIMTILEVLLVISYELNYKRRRQPAASVEFND